jgi:hypothetical protein
VALIVENGTGLANADAYISLGEFKAFCSDRNYRWEDYEDFAIESSIRLATGWIDTYSRYKAARLLPAQALEFPRSGLQDWSGYDVTGVPARVKQACAELAFKGLSEPLYEDAARGGMVKSESVGPISVTYEDGAPVGKVWQFAVNLLKPYVRDPDQLASSTFTVSPDQADSIFSVGMNDYETPRLSVE